MVCQLNGSSANQGEPAACSELTRYRSLALKQCTCKTAKIFLRCANICQFCKLSLWAIVPIQGQKYLVAILPSLEYLGWLKIYLASYWLPCSTSSSGKIVVNHHLSQCIHMQPYSAMPLHIY